MSPARPPPPSARLRAFPRDGVLTSFYAGRFPSIPGCLNRRSCGRAGRVYCLFSGGDNRKKQGALVERSGPKSSTLGLSNVAGVPVKEKAGMSAKERVVGKWAMD
uniref:Uncharacterized protein n=1 Tax=Zea mays TaxID=4577 RepID=A0A804Q9Z1_MAIZE